MGGVSAEKVTAAQLDAGDEFAIFLYSITVLKYAFIGFIFVSHL
jgi:hypothetical protein